MRRNHWGKIEKIAEIDVAAKAVRGKIDNIKGRP